VNRRLGGLLVPERFDFLLCLNNELPKTKTLWNQKWCPSGTILFAAMGRSNNYQR